jgi:MSHA pilin protein MshD
MCDEADSFVPSPACGGGPERGPKEVALSMRPYCFPLPCKRLRRNGVSRFALARGATLVEVVLFIVIIATAVTAVLGTLSLTVGRSADPLVARQALATAESMLQEVMSQPYTANDLDGGPDAMGPEAGETRFSSTSPFDHVDDYDGYSMNGIVKPDGTPVPGLSAYSASVAVQAQALDNIASGEGLLVTVTVTGPGGYSVSLRGFRARVAP